MKSKKILIFKKDKLAQWFLFWLAIGAGFIILMFLLTATWIGVDIKNQCQIAQAKYKGDCVQSLILTLEDETNSLRIRNQSIWALGQLGDARAKSSIENFYTSNIPNREPYDETLSQYEMKKALKLLNGGFNITHFVWNSDKI